MADDCPECGGNGYIIALVGNGWCKEPCNSCRGAGEGPERPTDHPALFGERRYDDRGRELCGLCDERIGLVHHYMSGDIYTHLPIRKGAVYDHEATP